MLVTQTTTSPAGAMSPAANGLFPPVLLHQTEKSVIDSFTKICGDLVETPTDPTDFAHGMKLDGIISFVGDLTFSLILVLPRETSETMAKKFAGFEIPFDSEDMGDVVGELTNVLAGVLCGGLESAGVKTQMSLPTITRGSDFEQLMSDNLISERLYFVASGSHFMIKLIMAKHR